jgi:MOSC domain-containing protein YiiM
MPSAAPLFSWLRSWSREERSGTLVGIFVSEAAGAPMRALEEIEAIAGAGLAGDRYAAGMGHWRRTDGCEVTLVTAEDMERASRRSGIPFAAGEHRRNLVVRGIPLVAFRRRRVRIGEVLLEFHRLRPPCGYLDRLYRPGAGKALGQGAGIGLRVLRGGRLRLGDAVEVLAVGEGGAGDS